MSYSKRSLYVDKERVFLVLELIQDIGPSPCVAVVASLPGREGTLTKKWKTVQGLLNSRQVADLQGWIHTSVANSLLAWLGVQESLPVE